MDMETKIDPLLEKLIEHSDKKLASQYNFILDECSEGMFFESLEDDETDLELVKSQTSTFGDRLQKESCLKAERNTHSIFSVSEIESVLSTRELQKLSLNDSKKLETLLIKSLNSLRLVSGNNLKKNVTTLNVREAPSKELISSFSTKNALKSKSLIEDRKECDIKEKIFQIKHLQQANKSLVLENKRLVELERRSEHKLQELTHKQSYAEEDWKSKISQKEKEYDIKIKEINAKSLEEIDGLEHQVEVLSRRLKVCQNALEEKLRNEKQEKVQLGKERTDQLQVYRGLRVKYLQIYKSFETFIKHINEEISQILMRKTVKTERETMPLVKEKNNVRNEAEKEEIPVVPEQVFQKLQQLEQLLEKEKSLRMDFETKSLINRNKLDLCLKNNINLTEQLDLYKKKAKVNRLKENRVIWQQLAQGHDLGLSKNESSELIRSNSEKIFRKYETKSKRKL
eukprot:snap_masked-scaffold_68-processed-gene-0.84-mRNA-1 protein AED:0.32 eAED:0.36 QI:0/-1/0/1/-1/1/1/0/455